MKWTVERSELSGKISIPASKSHTIRAFLIATLADGVSKIINPLTEGDGESALNAAKLFGAIVEKSNNELIVTGVAGKPNPAATIYMGNSGTGSNLFCSAAAIVDREITFDGDSSLRSRPMLPILNALKMLGAEWTSEGQKGYPPFVIKGPIKGGNVTVQGNNSQYLSSLLLTAPLLEGDTHITVTNLSEKPYVEITLWWLRKMGIKFEGSVETGKFTVYGGQSYAPICEEIAGDFSGATFSAVAAAITGGPISIANIDFTDPQGDKEVFNILKEMGATVSANGDGSYTMSAEKLVGRVIDLNAMPDALPALAVLGTVAEGETRLVNVAQARIKETDRITVMFNELRKMGADIEELPDGLIIRKSRLHGAEVCGHDDHRVVMALSLAGMIAEGITTVDTVESAAVTYPTFADDFIALGAKITRI